MPPVSRTASNDGNDEPRLGPVEFARHLRRKSTDAEHKLWQILRNRGLRGCKFRRQHPVAPYVLDFYCDRLKLAIELDGGGHASEEGRAYDQRRTHDLAREGIRVLRINNYEMLMHTGSALDWLWHQIERLEAERDG